MSPRRLAVVCDLAEENWPSMDLVADKLLGALGAEHASEVGAVRVQGSFRTRFGRLPLGPRGLAFNADRLLNRLLDYPLQLRRLARGFDGFHVCDHSYANLVHQLPAQRVGIFCHDLDTFRSVIEPSRDARPAWFRAMMRHVLTGLQKAAVVFHSTSTVRAEIELHGLIDSNRLVQARYGIAEEFNPEPADADARLETTLSTLDGKPFLLHVGSCIPRKRIDVLLDVFAALRETHRDLQLVQVGGEWSPAHREQLAKHQLTASVRQLPRMNQAEIAALYRASAVVLMPSEAEGFGLPVVEALACGSNVVASDIPVFREVGGAVVEFCPLADVPAWTQTVSRVLAIRGEVFTRASRLAWARQFSWHEHARAILSGYQRFGIL